MDTLKFVVELSQNRVRESRNPDMADFLRRLDEVHTLLATAPERITALAGFAAHLLEVGKKGSLC
jgi:hypothetical protein